MKFAHWAPCLLPLVLAACGGGGTTTTSTTTFTTTCNIIAAPSVTYAVPAAVYAGTPQVYTQNTPNFVPTPCSVEYTATNLPAGMSINAASGQISGTVVTPSAVTSTVSAIASGSNGLTMTGRATINFVFIKPVAWEVKPANHNIGSLSSPSLATIGSTLYAVGSQLVGINYVPLMYQSIDAGATWTNTTTPPPLPPATTSLRSFRVVSDGAALYLVGGRTSDTTVTAAASYAYNNDVLKFTPGSPGIWSTLAVNPFASAAFPLLGGKEEMALAWDASNATMYVHGGRRGSGVGSETFRSTDHGATWILVNSGSSFSLVNHCMMAANGNVFILGGLGFSPSGTTITEFPQALRSSNGGSSWSVVSNVGSLSTIRPVPAKAVGASCAATNGRLYVAGGANVLGSISYTGDVLQSVDNGVTWNLDPVSTIVGQRAFHGMAALSGKLVIFGGENATSPVTSVVLGTP